MLLKKLNPKVTTKIIYFCIIYKVRQKQNKIFLIEKLFKKIIHFYTIFAEVIH